MLLYSKYNSSEENYIEFVPLGDQWLPFPVNLSFEWRMCIALSLLLTLIVGTNLKIIIFKCLNSPDANLGPINYLIWFDQINGTFLAPSIIVRILSLLVPIPVSDIFGQHFCDVTMYLNDLYIAGRSMWSFFIALFRVLFVKGQKWLKKTIGVSNILLLMISSGLLVLFSTVSILFYFDDAPTYMICLRKSTENIIIELDYLVITKKLGSSKIF